MPRDTDEKKTRKALRKLRKAAERAEAEGIELSEWEQEFVEGIDERLNKYGSAFNDPNLGASDEALSRAQTEILRQLDKKSRGKGGSSFKQRKPLKAKKSGKTFVHSIRPLSRPDRIHLVMHSATKASNIVWIVSLQPAQRTQVLSSRVDTCREGANVYEGRHFPRGSIIPEKTKTHPPPK